MPVLMLQLSKSLVMVVGLLIEQGKAFCETIGEPDDYPLFYIRQKALFEAHLSSFTNIEGNTGQSMCKNQYKI